MHNYCLICQQKLGNVNPKSEKAIPVYNLLTYTGRKYKLRGYIHKKCLETDFELLEWD